MATKSTVVPLLLPGPAPPPQWPAGGSDWYDGDECP